MTYRGTYTEDGRTISSAERRATLSSVMHAVNDHQEPVLVTRAGGKPVVMVSLDDRASMDGSACLLASPANRSALRAAIAELEAGRVIRPGMPPEA